MKNLGLRSVKGAAEKLTKAQISEIKREAMVRTIGLLGLPKRVPELLRKKGWPYGDKDLVALLMAAVACKKLGAGGQRFPRPAGADAFGDLWPAAAFICTASQICDTLELDELLEFR